VLWSLGRVRLGILYFLVYRTSSVFSGLIPSAQSAVHLERVDPSDCREIEEILLAIG